MVSSGVGGEKDVERGEGRMKREEKKNQWFMLLSEKFEEVKSVALIRNIRCSF